MGNGMAAEARFEFAAPARHGRRADKPGGLDLVPRSDRWQALPDRRYLVADGDRHDFNHAFARGDADEARHSDAALFWRAAGGGESRGQARSEKERGQIGDPQTMAEHVAG